MLRKFFKDSFTYSITGIITTIISIFLVPVYTRIFVPADYGIIELFVIITSIINVTIALEIAQSIGRFILDTNNQNDRIKYASTALFFTLFVYSIFAVLVIFFAPFFSQLLLDDKSKSQIIIVGILSIWSGGIFYLLKEQLRWFSKVSQYAFINIFFSISTMLITILLVVFLNMGVIGVFYGLTVGNCLGIVLTLNYLKGEFGLIFDFQKLEEMLHFSLPLVPSSVGIIFSLFIDRIAIKELLGLNELGLYSVGYKVASIVGLLISSTQMAITPLVLKNYREKNTPYELVNIFRFFIIGAFISILFLGLFSRDILISLTTPAYYDASNVIVLITISLLLSGLYVFAPGLWIVKKTNYIAFINILATVINVILLFLLIPVLGIIGAAVATLISALIIFLINQLMSQTHYPIPYPWKKVLWNSLVVAILIFLGIAIPIDYPLLIIIKGTILTFGIFMTMGIFFEKGEMTKIYVEACTLFREFIYKKARII